MFQEITYYLIFGIPLIVYLGIVTISLFIVTALIGSLKRKGMIKISINWHYILAYVSIFFALIHGIFGLLAYL